MIGFPCEPIGVCDELVPINIASGAASPIVSDGQVGTTTQQDNRSVAKSIEYADGITREYINFRCKKCNYAVPVYLVQPTFCAAENKCRCGGA